jgi:hypothetical protein
VTNEPRKASEVLLELEAKIDSLISLVKAQNFANQILSNKITELMQNVNKQQNAPPVITAEAVNTLPKTLSSPLHNFKVSDPERQIPIMADTKLPEMSDHLGFRRNSRPESFAGDDVYLGQQFTNEQPKMPLQIPKGPPAGRGGPEIVIPMKQEIQPSQPAQQSIPKNSVVQNAVPVMQRVVNGEGKSVFLADVEIIDMSSSQQVSKTRTNGTGKWMASLGAGAYQVTIRKKGTPAIVQDIQIDGTQSPLELKTIIIK